MIQGFKQKQQTKNQTQTHKKKRAEGGKKPHKPLNKDVKHLTDFRGRALITVL